MLCTFCDVSYIILHRGAIRICSRAKFFRKVTVSAFCLNKMTQAVVFARFQCSVRERILILFSIEVNLTFHFVNANAMKRIITCLCVTLLRFRMTEL